jgi:transposase InsO family protein
VTAARQSYAIDFMHHRTVRGVVFRILVAVDEYTRELLCLRVARSFTTSDVARHPGELFAEYGTPNQVRSDNGPEFISKSLQQWLRLRGVQQVLSRPGKPCDNGLCESTNGRLRDELLRPELFNTIKEAEDAVARFREEYNTIRPHSALDGLTPTASYQRLAPATVGVE